MTNPATAGSGKAGTHPAEHVNFQPRRGLRSLGGGESPVFFGDSHEKNHSKQAREASPEGRAAAYASSQDRPDARRGH